jgi:hypothetical protein
VSKKKITPGRRPGPKPAAQPVAKSAPAGDEDIDAIERFEEIEADAEEELVEAIEDGEPEEYIVPEWNYSLTHLTPDPVYESDLKALLKSWRQGRATKTIGQVLADGYVTIFMVLIAAAMVGGAVWQAQSATTACETQACQAGRVLLPWVMLFAAFALTLAICRIFGPVVASSAEGFWLMDAPIRRARLLRGRLIGVLAAVTLGAAALGAILAALTGYAPSEIVLWAAALGLGSAGLTAFGAFEQTCGRTWLTKAVQWLFGAAAFAALIAITGVAAGWFDLGFADPSEATLGTSTVECTGSVLDCGGPLLLIIIGVAALGVVFLLLFGALALARLDEIHRARLVSGGNLVTGMQGAAFALDLGLMRDILVERDAQAKGHVRPTLGFGHGLSALVGREIQRLWRYPKRLLLFAVSIGVPYAVGALGLTTFNPFISAIVLLIAFVPILGSLRVITRTRGLARLFPFSNSQLRYATVSIGAGLAVLWAGASALAFRGIGVSEPLSYSQAAIRSLLTAFAGLLAAVRWVAAKPADYSSPMMQTGFGAMPPSLMFNLFKGLDVAIVITGPIMLNWSPWISVVVALVVAYFLSGSFDMQEAQQMQEEMKKEKERAKSGGSSSAGGPKKVITPPRR